MKTLRIFLIISLFLTQSLPGWSAIGASTVWRVRVSGANTNGGGYDSTIAGATTDYTDQDAAQLTLTDVVTIGNTTVTSLTGGFTTAMIGNCIRIAGDNYYFITARANTNSITVDRNTGTAVAQSAKVGGAFATLDNFWIGGSITLPSITTPLAPGHTVYVRGSGSDSPGSDDYTYPASVYSMLPNGDTTNGRIQIIGYNGRPRMNYSGLMAYQAQYLTIENLYLFVNGSAAYPTYGFASGGSGVYAKNIKVDTNGINDVFGLIVNSAIGCYITNNSGTTSLSSGSRGIYLNQYGGIAYGNFVEKQRGTGIEQLTNSISSMVNNIISSNTSNCMIGSSAGGSYGSTIMGNTCYSNGGDGLNIPDKRDALNMTAINNIFSNNGGYGINSPSTTPAFKGFFDYNDFYLNTSGAYNNITAGTHDLTLNPQFTNAAGGNLAIGTNLKAQGYPGAFTGGATIGYFDMGAAQRQESSGASGGSYTFVQ